MIEKLFNWGQEKNCLIGDRRKIV